MEPSRECGASILCDLYFHVSKVNLPLKVIVRCPKSFVLRPKSGLLMTRTRLLGSFEC